MLGRAAWPVDWAPVRRRHHLARFLATEDHARRISIAWWGVSLPRRRLHQARHQIPTDGCAVTAACRSSNRRASPCIDQTAADRSLPRIIGVWARRQIKRHRQRSPIGLEVRGLTRVSEDMPPAAQCCEVAFAWAAAWWSLQLRRLPPRARYHGPLATWENPVGIGVRGPLRVGPSGGAFDYPSPTSEADQRLWQSVERMRSSAR